MPIQLIRKLTRKLTGNASSKEEGRPDRSRKKATLPEPPPAKRRTVLASSKPAEIWRPGDPVPETAQTPDRPTASPSSRPRQRSRKPASTRPAPASGPHPEPAAAPSSGSRRRRSRGRRKSASAGPGAPPAADAATPMPVASEWTPADDPVEPQEGKVRFHDLGLPDSILHGIADLGFQFCTPIQARVLQDVAEGHNVAGKAQTGTGKTAAFLILTFKQFLQHPAPKDRPCGRPRALVLAPTRELVIQIARDAEAIGKYTGIRSLAVYGGADYDRQEKELMAQPVDLVAATPGRLLDFRRKGTLDLGSVEVLVIDEADRMLDMGFIPDVKTIIRHTPPKDQRRTLLFSATLTDDVMRLASQWMAKPKMVEIEPEHVAVDTVRQLVYMVRAQEKFTVLYNLLKRPAIGRVLVFANRRDQTDRIAFELKRYGIACEVLSGAVDQKKRMRVLDEFRAGRVKTVVATDVAGRGLHVDQIDHVVNFDLPYEAEDYVHRIGRTGRAGAHGTAVSFACEDESFGIPDIEAYIGEPLSCRYPEEVLLTPLPAPQGPAYTRPPRQGPSTGRGGRRGTERRGTSRRR